MAKVKDFRPATRNANKHTARGLGALEQSIQTDGWIGAMTTAADGEMIAGSARIETVAQVFGTDAEPIVIESDGSRPVVIVRTDIPNADDKRAQRLALADNRVHQLDLSWSVEVLAGLDADVLAGLWTGEELSDLGQQWADEVPDFAQGGSAEDDESEGETTTPSTGELLKLVNVTIAEPAHKVEAGEVWHLGRHILVVSDVITGWQKWVSYLEGEGVIFCPYPGPFVPLTLKANAARRAVMVQPDTYIAGHILDRYAEINGEKDMRRE